MQGRSGGILISHLTARFDKIMAISLVCSFLITLYISILDNKTTSIRLGLFRLTDMNR